MNKKGLWFFLIILFIFIGLIIAGIVIYFVSFTESTDKNIEDFEEVNDIVGGNEIESETPESNEDFSSEGYILAGNTESFGDSSGDIYLIKTDSNGNEQWSKTLGEDNWFDSSSSIQITHDGGYIIVGTTGYANDAGHLSGVYLIKTDSNGNEQWSKIFFNEYSSAAGKSVQQTTDGGYVLVGYGSNAEGDFFGYLIKTDSNGNEQWNKIYGGDERDYLYSVQQTTDGGYILAGSTSSFGNGFYDTYLIKTDSNGNEQWSKTFDFSAIGTTHFAKQTLDGGYLYISGANLIKTDSNGNEEWIKDIGNYLYESFKSFQQLSSGDYILAGITKSFEGDREFYLVKTDSNGNELWSRTFGGDQDDNAQFVQITRDGGYILVGDTYSLESQSIDIYLVKTDSNGNELWSRTFGGEDYGLDLAYSVQVI